MIDLTIALNCIRVMKDNGTYDGQKIGMVRKDLPSEVFILEKGKVVLYKEEMSPSDSQLCMGEYLGTRQKSTGKVTLESPLCQEEIEKQRAKGLLITTCGTIIGVPIKYIEEIRI